MAESKFPDALAEARKNLEALLRDRQQLDIEIAKWQQAVSALKSVAEPDPDEATTTGFTDIVRSVLKAAKEKGPLSAPQVREGMLNFGFGFDLARYAQPLATIHVVLKRLVKNGEVREIGDSESKTYWWALHGEPPSSSTRQNVSGPRRSKRVVPVRGEVGKRR